MNNKPQLFCFTYAGGTSAFFNEIENDMSELELVKLEYAGHGYRHKEKFYTSFDELSADMFHQFKERYANNQYGLFGYSMGSITLVETLHYIIKEGMQVPSHVFLAAHEPHTKTELLGFTNDELDEWVKRRTIEFGAVPDRLLDNKVFWRTYLPLYRADYSIIGKYKFEELDLKTSIPATIFYSETDTPRIDMELWRQYFLGLVNFHRYDGRHFFIQNHHKEMAQIIKSDMGVCV